MNTPQIIVPDYKGKHNEDLKTSAKRLVTSQSYQDLSTIILCPTRGSIPARIVQAWLALIKPMNQKVLGPIFLIGMEVGEAYNQGINMILNSPDLSKWKYVLTIEEDNAPPPDGLIKLYENMDKYDVVGGLYWTKGEGGAPMIYGSPNILPKNFISQIPEVDTIQPCNGLGMGFTLFKLDIFKKMPNPWFKTLQNYEPGVGTQMYTQDLYFFENAGKYGYKVACDTRVKVGHLDVDSGTMW